jgi:hypothetical protein
MDFSWMNVDQLLNLAFDSKQLAQLDQGDKIKLIRELAIRVQNQANELQVLSR